ncbi:hypothetical protein [Microcystis aeruginosa]|nr:hypothetical protein [Microcystis aeruginosa]
MSRKRVSRRNPFSVRYSTDLVSDPDALPFDDDWENAAIISAYNKLTSQ